MHELRGASVAQRTTLALIAGAWVALAWWLLLGPGLAIARQWFPWIGRPGDAGGAPASARASRSTTSGYSSRNTYS
ncbi:MAG TPA: hypothetical protein VMT86_03125 [Bryobacteraceae bacterium]|nr:hypothetical protein [Bryobacteraceae bacterium]